MVIRIEDDWESEASTTGTIFFEDEEFCFPYCGYSDFPIDCVEAWVDTIIELRKAKSKNSYYQNEIFFYDDPHFFTITRFVNSEDITLSFFSGISFQNDKVVGDNKIGEKVMNLDSYEKMMMDAVHRILYLGEHNKVNLGRFKRKIKKIRFLLWITEISKAM